MAPSAAPPVAMVGGWRSPRPALVLAAMVMAYTVVYSAFDVIAYRYYLYTDFDLALFAQAVDGLLHGRLFTSIRGMAWPGDHSSLVLFLIAPLYALVRHPVTLLVLQSAAQALGALPIYALARRELGHTGLALTLAAVYLLQPALGYADLFEFHPELLATAPLIAAFYFLRCGRLGGTLLWAGLALLCREDVALVVFMMALYALLPGRTGRLRTALALAAMAAASAFLTWGVLRPAFSHGEAEYARIYGRWGETLGAAALHMLRDPIGVAVQLVSTPGVPRDTLVKQQFHLTLFLPLGLLPLLSPLTLVLALPAFLEHLLSYRIAQHTILCQYTALQVPFVSAAAVLGTRNLLRLITRGAGSGARAATAAALGASPDTVDPRAAVAVMVWGILASVVCQLWFGPLLSSGRFFLAGTRDGHFPTAEERALKPYHDRMVRRVPRHGAVVAGFEFLSRFTGRDSVHSLHHLMRGTYTFSRRAYPLPAGVTALIANMAAINIVTSVEPETAPRLQRLLNANGLVPVDEAGDLVLFTRAGRPALDLVTAGSCPDDSLPPIVFDRELAFTGAALVDSTARPGGTVTLATCWRRVGEVDRVFQTRLDLVDASGRLAQSHVRDLGYGLWPAHIWLAGAPVRETYRLVLDADLGQGDYDVVLRVQWRGQGGGGMSAADEASGYAPERGITLGRVRVTPR